MTSTARIDSSSDAMSGAELRLQKLPGWAVPTALGVVWLSMGMNFLGFKIAGETLPPFLMVAVRLVAAGVILLVLGYVFDARLHANRRRRAPTFRQLRSAAMTGMLLLVVGQGALVWGVQRVAAGTAAVLASSMPLWLALLSVIWLKKPLSKQEMLGLAIGFVGLVILSLSKSGGSEALDPLAAAAILAGALGAAAGVLYSHDADLPENAVLGTAVEMLAAGGVLSGVSFAFGEPLGFSLDQVSDRSLWALLYLVLGGGVIGFCTFAWLTRATSASTASTFAYVGPVVALALSFWFLDEKVGSAKLVAALLALGGAALMVARKGAPPCPSKVRPCTQ